MQEIKILELFGGIGAIRKAFERQNIPHKVVDYVEIDKYAVKSYNAMFGENFETQDITKWDKQIDVDFIMHGSPCQDFSVAGKQAGGDLGSGTRSSLMYETIRIVGQLRPKYVMWENVKNLLSKKHKHNFDAYIETMDILGYNSYYQVLNAKDYGIPQNRERVYTISIRKDVDKGSFKFPEKEELKLRLKDMLEDEVDEKYYLKESSIKNLQRDFGSKAKEISSNGICDTLQAAMGNGGGNVPVLRIGGIFDTENSKHQAGSVYDKQGLAPTLDAMQGGWRQPSIVEEPKIEVVGNYSPSNHDASRIVNIDGLAPTVKENHGTVTAIQIKNATKKGYLEGYPGDGVYINPGAKRGTVQKEMIQTLTSFQDKGVILNDLRIRKLTPKECWRLMGFDDKDFENAAKVNSNTQLYKQAGNSIVVNVLEKILQNLFKED